MSLINWYKKYTTFQKCFLWVFVILTIISFFLPLCTGATWGEIFTLDAIIGFFSSITGILNSIYVCRAEIILYLYWGLNTLFYGTQCYLEHLYAQFFLNIIIVFPIIVVGFFIWRNTMKKSRAKAASSGKEEKPKIRKFTKKHWTIAIIVFIIGWILYSIFAYYFPNIMQGLFNASVQPDHYFIIDSFIAIGTIYAVVLTDSRNVENWIFWLVANCAGTGLFLYTTIQSALNGSISVIEIAGAIMYIQYLTSSIYGYYCWVKLMKAQKQEGTIDAIEDIIKERL